MENTQLITLPFSNPFPWRWDFEGLACCSLFWNKLRCWQLLLPRSRCYIGRWRYRHRNHCMGPASHTFLRNSLFRKCKPRLVHCCYMFRNFDMDYFCTFHFDWIINSATLLITCALSQSSWKFWSEYKSCRKCESFVSYPLTRYCSDTVLIHKVCTTALASEPSIIGRCCETVSPSTTCGTWSVTIRCLTGVTVRRRVAEARFLIRFLSNKVS